MAQDFHAAFSVGEDNRHINSMDADGVALAAIQGLYEMVMQQRIALRAQEKRIAALEDRLAQLDKTARR